MNLDQQLQTALIRIDLLKDVYQIDDFVYMAALMGKLIDILATLPSQAQKDMLTKIAHEANKLRTLRNSHETAPHNP